jgi:hypothetical protein
MSIVYDGPVSKNGSRELRSAIVFGGWIAPYRESNEWLKRQNNNRCKSKPTKKSYSANTQISP